MATGSSAKKDLALSHEASVAVAVLRLALGIDGGYVDAVVRRAKERVKATNPLARGITEKDVADAIDWIGPFGTPLGQTVL